MRAAFPLDDSAGVLRLPWPGGARDERIPQAAERNGAGLVARQAPTRGWVALGAGYHLEQSSFRPDTFGGCAKWSDEARPLRSDDCNGRYTTDGRSQPETRRCAKDHRGVSVEIESTVTKKHGERQRGGVSPLCGPHRHNRTSHLAACYVIAYRDQVLPNQPTAGVAMAAAQATLDSSSSARVTDGHRLRVNRLQNCMLDHGF